MKNLETFMQLVQLLIQANPTYKPLVRFVYHTRVECPGMFLNAQAAWDFLESGMGVGNPETATSNKVIEVRVAFWEDVSLCVSLHGINNKSDFASTLSRLNSTGKFPSKDITFNTKTSNNVLAYSAEA